MTSLRIRIGAVCREDDEILLVEHEKDGKRYWLLPGGGMRVGETAEEALVREVFEETSLTVEVGRQLYVCESISPDRTRHIVHLVFEASRVGGSPGASADPRVRASAFVPIESLPNIILYPPVSPWLMKGFKHGFTEHLEYLGEMWE